MVLQLPKLLDDGCVLQAGATIHIWGAGDPGRGVLVRLDGKDRTTRVGDDGSWSVPYGPIKAGGPYDLTVRYEDGTECISRQCYAGEVFLCSGQSNMELPMAWVRADYPLEWDREPDPLLRQYKAIPDCDFNGPRSDHDHAFWQGSLLRRNAPSSSMSMARPAGRPERGTPMAGLWDWPKMETVRFPVYTLLILHPPSKKQNPPRMRDRTSRRIRFPVP